MNQLPRALTLACALALSPLVAHAAPVTLQYGVVFDEVCYMEPFDCTTGPLDGYTLTLTFEDALLPSSISDPSRSRHVAKFGPPTMTLTGGPFSMLANPFGTITEDRSELSLGRTEPLDTPGFGFTRLIANYDPRHEQWVPVSADTRRFEAWQNHIVFQWDDSDWTSDGITTMPTVDALIAELTTHSFSFNWTNAADTRDCPVVGICNSPSITVPGSLFASGTATPLTSPPPSVPSVPEPASLLLVGCGLVAGGVRQLRRRLGRAASLTLTLAGLLPLSPAAAHAAPVTLQYSVVLDGICYSGVLTCPAGPLTGYTLMLTYDDQMTADVSNPPAGFHEARFGAPTMTMTGGSITALPNPFGTVTHDLSRSFMRQLEFPDSGFGSYGHTQVEVGYSPAHQAKVPAGDGSFNAEYWDERITLNRLVQYTDVDGITTLPTPADMLAELSTGTFQLFWSTSVTRQSQCPESWDLSCRGPFLIEPGTFFAWGTATALGPVPSTVPEPASLLLVGLGLIAGGARLRRRRPLSR